MNAGVGMEAVAVAALGVVGGVFGTLLVEAFALLYADYLSDEDERA